MEQQKKEKKNNKGKYILIGLGVVAIAGTAIYFATKNKNKSNFEDEIESSFETNSTLPVRTGGGSSGFPLKKGSRGDLVKNVQEALVSKYGAGILPKFGADGSWGSEMQTALIAKGLPTTITADDFTKIIGPGGTGITNTTKKKKFRPALVASNLRIAIIDDNLSKALRSLSVLKSVKGYTAVNTEFKKKRIGGVRKTVVNALLSKFSGTSEKKKLNSHFYRFGLKYNGSQWSLSGLGQILCDQLKTTEETDVWNASGLRIRVPKHTILGHFIDGKNGITKFKTLDDKTLFINTKCICYV